MPFYKIWYRNNPEPLEASSAGRLSESQIVELVVQKENITAHAPASGAPTVQEIIDQNKLSPVRYAEDEGEPFTIG